MSTKPKGRKPIKIPPKKQYTFSELVDEATRCIHSGLLKGGGSEMRLEVWLRQAIQWQEDGTEDDPRG